MIHKIKLNELKSIVKQLIKEEMSLDEGFDYQKFLGKALASTNQLINQAKIDDIDAIEPDSTWESHYIFDKVVLMNTRLKVYYKEYSGTGKGWENKVDETNLTQDRQNNFTDSKQVLSWIRRAIKKGYTEERRSSKKQSKEDFESDY